MTVKRTYRAGDAGTGVDNAAGRGCCGEITVFETHPLIQMDEYLDAEKKRGACPGCLAGNRGKHPGKYLHAPTAEALAGSAGGKERQH